MNFDLGVAGLEELFHPLPSPQAGRVFCPNTNIVMLMWILRLGRNLQHVLQSHLRLVWGAAPSGSPSPDPQNLEMCEWRGDFADDGGYVPETWR